MTGSKYEKATIDLTTGVLLFKESGLKLAKGMPLVELTSTLNEIDFRDSHAWDPVTGFPNTDPNWERGKEGFAYFQYPIEIEGTLFHLTADISDYRINFLAMKAVNQFIDNVFTGDWPGERMVRQIHREWLSRWLKRPADTLHPDKKWIFEWGRIVDYYDEVQWGAAIWIIQNPGI